MTTFDLFKLNVQFCRLTQQQVKLDFMAEHVWFDWLNYFKEDPFTEADLMLVVAYVKRHQGQNGGYTPSSLLFRRLIGQPDRFLELRGLARAENRKPQRTERDRVLELTGRRPDVSAPISTAGAVLERTKLAGMLAEWKRNL